ncbi:MAG TPA: copper-translocating P-type ATPase [Galbitalea sp.]|jgi:Cu2+-exporting ATPase|nr:copper-translocating P-type ATPase [Galbitalea sp.]
MDETSVTVGDSEQIAVPESVGGFAAHDHGHGGDPSASSGSGHDHHDHVAQFRRLFWVCLILTVPTLVFSTGLQDILHLTGPRFPGSEWIPAVFGLAIFIYGGRIFLAGGWSELRARKPGMMLLISLAIVVAFGYSAAVTLGLAGMDFWWELATLITIMLLGHWIEMAAVMRTGDALGELATLIPDVADVVHGDHVMSMPVAQTAVGDLVLVRPGGSVPVDGEVTEGESDVNEALLTGESAAVAKSVGSSVVAGSINGSGALTIRVTNVGDDTALAGVMKLVAEAQASKSGAQILADRAAGWLFYIAVGAAIITAGVWYLILPTDPNFVLERVVTVLVIACPHALGLAIPLVAQISTSLGARNGILIRSRAALEDARLVSVVLFDKTGTLTEGRQGVTEVVPVGAATEDELRQLAAAVEARSEHPIARAIVSDAAARKLPKLRIAKFESLAGRGVEATIDGAVVTIAAPRLLTERGIHLDPLLVHASRDAAADGKTVVYVVRTPRGPQGSEQRPGVLGMIALADVIRPESADAVARLKARGIRVAMLTGDTAEVARWVGGQLGIDEIFSEVLPADKSDVVERLQKSGVKVAMVGDGVNDAPALARADVGIAIGAGTDVAIESAGVILASSDPRGVARVIKLSRATYAKMLQNLVWGAGYNIVGIPLAAGVLFGAGVLLAPAVGALLMSISTVVVALNAQLLRRLRL